MRYPLLKVKAQSLHSLIRPAAARSPFCFLSITYNSALTELTLTVLVLTLEFSALLLECIQPAQFHLYTSSAYLRPNFKLNLSWTLSWQDLLNAEWGRSKPVRRDTPSSICGLSQRSSLQELSQHSSRFVSLLASKSQTSHGTMPCCSFVACPGVLSTHWQWARCNMPRPALQFSSPAFRRQFSNLRKENKQQTPTDRDLQQHWCWKPGGWGF